MGFIGGKKLVEVENNVVDSLGKTTNTVSIITNDVGVGMLIVEVMVVVGLGPYSEKV